MACIGDDFCVLVERALGILERRRGPQRAAARELLVRDAKLNCVFHSVDRNDVAVLDKRNRAPVLRFWNDVANAESVRSKWCTLARVQTKKRSKERKPKLSRPSENIQTHHQNHTAPRNAQ